MADEAAAAADPPSLQRQSAAAAGAAASSNDMDAIRGQPALADRLESLKIIDDEDEQPDRTLPHPAPIASTSSSPRPSGPVEPDLAPQQPGEIPQPAKRKVVLLKRPATPTNRANEDRDRRSDEPTSSSDPIDRDYSSHSQENSGSATTPASPYGTASPGDLADADSAAAAPALDPVLHGALNHPRDRFLLLRAEVELERFILNQTMTRLPLAPPHFQPGLNSYQRLLIHRLADMFGITREVEPAPPTMWNAGMINPATGQPQGVVVLVKSEIASIPSKKLASYVPAPDTTPSVASPAPHRSVARTSSSAVSSPAASPDNSSPAASVAAAAPPPQPVFKILPRASRGTSSASSSADVDDDGSSSFSTSTRSKLRRDLTLEEREAAYKEARERIFNRPDPVEQPARTTPPAAPPSTSAASSNAGEDAASIQSSLGYGITRPSSAGSTFSRSSAALSVSGQRPPPSIASDSNSSMRSGYFGYYHQQQPGSIPPPPLAPPAGSGGIPYPMPNLRQAAPSFDPATGGWTYHPTTPMLNEFAQTPSSYSSMMSPYGGMQSPPAPPMMMPQYQQPATASAAPTLQYDASSGAAMTPSASWHRNLPSPALSAGSSGNSYPPSQQQQPPSGPSSASASANPDAGYLMRFPEGAIVTAGGGVVGPPQPYAAVAVEAGLRSASTLSLGASSSASRVAVRGGTSSGPNSLRRLSQSTTQSLGSGASVHSSSAPLSDDAASSSPRRSPSATSGAADDSPEASLAGENSSEVGSSAGGGGGSGPSSLAGGGGGSSDGKRHGRKATIVGRRGRPDRPREVEDGGEESSREPSPLHPSLPAKPSWAAAAAASSAQTAPPTSAGSSSSPHIKSGDHQVGALSATHGGSSLASLASSSAPHGNGGAPGFPPLSRPVGSGPMPTPPPPPPPPPVQGAWTRPSGAYAGLPAGPPPSAPNGYTQYGTAVQAPSPHVLQHPHPHQQQQQLQQQSQQHPHQQQHHLQPSSYSAWLSQAAVGPPPVQVNYQPGPAGARHPTQAPPSFYAPPQPPPAGPPADLMTMPDMRRPPPRSTQLFDPNKPTNSGGMRRVASGTGSARRM
ncbi:hypothetical protein JCM8115_002411 [Rhodotorula mucilaginosa]|nr:hypothetical protein B0A53_04362 [Rhodotorula sp. CCFEE 5036]